jgi:RNA polymerase sigma-70 factor (ECF subfamily)
VSDTAGAPKTLDFADAYRNHFRFVWRTLSMLGVREGDLMDMTQNVFVVVHRQLATFEGRSELTTWLFSICRLVVKDYRRSARFRREVLVDVSDLAGRVAESDAPQRHLDSDDLRRILEAILDRLPEKLRVAFVLFEVEEMPGEDIARLLDVPIGTVRSRLRLARAAFQRQVKILGIAVPGRETGHDRPGLPRMRRA